ncbi:MAG: rod shape-determining protein RodA [Fidelibacterota bacterium]|nr:MAG: rod shape-determining protein RodA [Candidatus Neomarinimicrobiota bacterium]
MLGKNWLKSLKGQPNLIVWDALLLIPVVLLLLIGLVGLYSTSLPGSLGSSNFLRQTIWLIISLLVVWLLRYLHPRIYYTQAYRLYAALIFLLLVTYLMPAFSGGKRWLVLGPLSLQPAEFGKILVVLAIARYLTDYQKYLDKFLYALVPLAVALLPAILIVGQPDLGTAIIYLAVVIPMMYWSGISTFHLFIILTPLVSLITGFNFYTFSAWMLVMILVLYFSRTQPRWSAVVFIINALFGTLTPVLWNRLQPYQQRRIITLLDASTADPHGAGYQVLQSRTAIGSGGVFGKGLGEGTQTHLRFLPVSDTDFIISVIGEEAGFIAILAILILFGWMLLRMLDRASTTQYRFTSLAIIGFATIIMIHVFVNMSMATGLMPVTGLPLPFLSYGGSFLLTCLLLVGVSHYLLTGES